MPFRLPRRNHTAPHASRPGRRVARRTIVLTGTALAVVAAPIAMAAGEGSTIRGGARNPSSNQSQQYTAETQIIASNSTFGTRQSNKGTGGGAIYGCRSLPSGPGCISAVNLNTGGAFQFSTAGSVGGTITVKDPNGAPFTTNAKGVVTNLNSNFLQGKQAVDFVGTGQLLFAIVSQAGTLGTTRGATASALTSAANNTYTVTFAGNVSKCAYTASPQGAALTNGSIGVAPDPVNGNIVDVNAPAALPGGFHLQVTC